MSVFKKLIILGASTFAISACTDVKLIGLHDQVASVSADGQYCTLNVTMTPGIKFYLAVDVTGSNQGGDVTDDGIQVGPTDPGKPIRFGALQGLGQKYPEALFALRTFAGDTVNDAFRSSYFPFVSQAGYLNSTLPTFMTVPDDGGTNYQVILQQIQTDIQQYLQAQLNLPTS